MNLIREGDNVSLRILHVTFVIGFLAQRWGEKLNFLLLSGQWKCVAGDECQSAVLRVAYATILFFLLTAVICYCYPRWQYSRYRITAHMLLIGGAIFCPNALIISPALLWATMAVGFLFLVAQTVILVDQSILINNKLLEYESGERNNEREQWTKPKLILLCLSIGMFAIVIILAHSMQDQSSGQLFSFISLFLIACCVVCQLFNRTVTGNLFASSVVACYIMHLTHIAVSFNPTDPPNTTLFGIIECFDGVGLYTIVLTSFILCSPSTTELNAEESHIQRHTVSYRSVENNGEVQSTDEDVSETVAINVWMVLITCAWFMNLSNFGQQDTNNEEIIFWGHILSAWLAAFLYMWILLAPQLFPGRVF